LALKGIPPCSRRDTSRYGPGQRHDSGFVRHHPVGAMGIFLRSAKGTSVPGYKTRVNSIGFRVFHFPRVKSGNSTGLLRLATDFSVSAVITLEVTES
jgi:hypothetical protein